MKFKRGVRILGAAPEIVLVMIVADQSMKRYGSELVVTSMSDGLHMVGSFHFVGWAFDGRLPSTSLDEIVDDMRKNLPDGVDIVVEDNHLHLEYDPRKKVS